MITKRYNLINNVGGWLIFAVALITYWLTLEPTASYWDCGEFIIQADKLEVGHPPGNPIFMLTARFFANFAPDAQHVALMVNAMSGLLSALTILLLFWTITHLVRRIVVKDGQTAELTLQQYLAIMGSGAVGALAYCWSDTFWFSAVEGEVYAFSSFCTALVFWLILKWETRADEPHSDRYLVLIAYIIGVSIAVHLLNLLCIPAIVLVFAYRKFKDMNVLKSLMALGVSFVIVALVLFGLVPGFIKVAQQFELFFVNTWHLPFNSGTLIYAIVTLVVFLWALTELHRQRNRYLVMVSFVLAITLSGMLFPGDSAWVGWVLTGALCVALWFYIGKGLPVRILNLIMWSVAVIFVGYSSYALILIRSSANTPMNQNAPDNVFDLAYYLNREQYGESPLLYGETLYSPQQMQLVSTRTDTIAYYSDGTPFVLNTPYYDYVYETGAMQYAKGVKGALPSGGDNLLVESSRKGNESRQQRGGDYYVDLGLKQRTKYAPELNMLFPRMYPNVYKQYYSNWAKLDTSFTNLKELHAVVPETGEEVALLDVRNPQLTADQAGYYYPQAKAFKPSFGQNMQYFFNYQLNHMYLRYFMWNFAGRQNDICNQFGELDAGNWISGIGFIDDARLGDQSLLPPTHSTENAGHNVYYMLPLLLGVIGLLWQAFAGRRGIEQFWVVFFLFFMTGIAIVLYLNQPPMQPRERDYAFAGSFYAFAIWIGMGVAGLWRLFMLPVASKLRVESMPADTDPVKAAEVQKNYEEPLQPLSVVEEPKHLHKASVWCAAAACVLGIAVPVQMVSQTWDDHDRSGRYAARDFAVNYLESLEPNAIIFCNGDNDTFPLWYAQEVEGVRPDVKIVNLSYLNSTWYTNQHRLPSYTAAPVDFTARPEDYAYDRLAVVTISPMTYEPVELLPTLKAIYAGKYIDPDMPQYFTFPSPYVYIPVDADAVIKAGLVAEKDRDLIPERLEINLAETQAYRSKGYLSLSDVLLLDIVATNAANGWKRPIYWANTVGDEYHIGLTPYTAAVGMTHQLVALPMNKAPRTDKAYDVIMNKYRWGGLDTGSPYYDETAARMLTKTRITMTETAQQLLSEGEVAAAEGDGAKAKADYKRALDIVDKLEAKLPDSAHPYDMNTLFDIAELLCQLGAPDHLNDRKVTERGLKLYEKGLLKFIPNLRYSMYLTRTFEQPSTTYENLLVPYRYYGDLTSFIQWGGDAKRVDAELRRAGIDVQTLQTLYSHYSGLDSYGDDSEGISPEEFQERMRTEMESYAASVNRLAALSPEEYAAADPRDLEIDSIYYYIYTMMADQYGIEGEFFSGLEEFGKVDLERSKRIWEVYAKKHPEAFTE